MREYTVFVSYARDDDWIVAPITRILCAAGVPAFKDTDSIAPGDDWVARICSAIEECERFLLFWCEHSMASEFVAEETASAIALGKRVVPILIDGTELPDHLARLQAIRLDDGHLQAPQHDRAALPTRGADHVVIPRVLKSRFKSRLGRCLAEVE